MKKIMLLLVSLLFVGAQVLQAQSTITGSVISADDNQGIPGVQVTVRGTTMGTTTNVMGQYSINVPSGATHLVFSFMGKKTQEIAIESRTTIDVTLESDVTALQEFVVTGYGVTRRSAFTGSAVAVGSDVITRQTEANMINALQGAVPGMQISNSAGQPGSASSILIRGIGSLHGNRDPLYVIDGVPQTAGNVSSFASTGGVLSANTSPQSTDPLAGLDANDIESITVLKDASATAIYGSRASNGVIVITTKRGKEGPGQVNVNLKTGLTMRPQMSRKNQMLNLADYETLMIEGEMARQEVALAQTPNRETAISTLRSLGILRTDDHDVDWWDEVSRVGKTHEASISASGGSERRNYFLSLGYLKNEFYLHGSEFERFSARSNIEYRANKWVTIGLNVSGSFTNQDQTGTMTSASNPWRNGRLMRPNEPVKNPDGTWNFNTSQQGVGYNIVARHQDPDRSEINTKNYNALIMPFVRLDLYKNVFFQTKVSFDVVQLNERRILSATVDGEGKLTDGFTALGNSNSTRQFIVNTLNWAPTINGVHNFNVLIGQEAQKTTNTIQQASYRGFLHYRLREVSADANSRGYSTLNYSTLLSYFSNLEYDLHHKYYLSASLRRDGSSRVGDNNLWGTFYSVGGRWRISQEPFMQATQKYINNMALRMSYGTTGNLPTDLHAWAQVYNTVNPGATAPPIVYSIFSGTGPFGIGNPDLKWESKNKFNVGMELLALNRISFEIDYYHEVINDMLYARPVSQTAGGGNPLVNFASMENKGVEIQVNAVVVDHKDFRWTIGANMSANRNNVLDIGTKDTINRAGLQWSAVGMPWNSFFAREFGVCPTTGLGGWKQDDGTYLYGATTAYGTAPPVFIGTPYAKFWGGFNTRLSYKGFDFSTNFFYSLGGYHYSSDAYSFETDGWSSTFPNVNYYYFDNRWTKPGDDAKAPRYVRGYSYGSESQSTRYLMKANFLRLRNVTLGYAIPKNITSKASITNARIYASLDNLFTWTPKDYRGLEPDAGLVGGTQSGQYAQPRNFIVGINFTF